MKRARKRIAVTEGSGNVFADLGFSNADDLLARAELTRQVCAIVRSRRLTQTRAAELLGLRQPDVSLLLRGKYTRFSVERLLKLLNRLGRDVRIVVRPVPRSRDSGHIRVVTG